MHCSRQVCSHLLYILVVDLIILVSPFFLKRLQWRRASHTVHRWSSSRIASSLVQSDGSGTVQLVKHIAVCTIAIIGNHRRRQIVTGRKLERQLRWRPQKQTQAKHCHHHRWNSYLSQLEENIALSFSVHSYQSAYLIQMSVCLTACLTVTYFTRTPLALAFRESLGKVHITSWHISIHHHTAAVTLICCCPRSSPSNQQWASSTLASLSHVRETRSCSAAALRKVEGPLRRCAEGQSRQTEPLTGGLNNTTLHWSCNKLINGKASRPLSVAREQCIQYPFSFETQLFFL